jgi:F0F1-type ATP synthase assembly protein I
LAGGAGYLLDSWLGTTPWLTFAGLAFGITSAVLLAYKNFRKFV